MTRVFSPLAKRKDPWYEVLGVRDILVPGALLTHGQRRGALAKSKPDTIKTWYPVKHSACSIRVEHALCLTGYHVFIVSSLDFARAPLS
jgi:hypothetical protein